MNLQFQKYINEMAKVDQAARFAAVNSKGQQPLNLIVYAIDLGHNYRINEMIKKYGYPTKKKVGPVALKLFWLLIQHQDFDLDLQKKCLKKCGFAQDEYSLLTDRILVNSGKPQRYGTQLNAALANRKRIDKERQKLGLVPLQVYLDQVQRIASKYKNNKKS